MKHVLALALLLLIPSLAPAQYSWRDFYGQPGYRALYCGGQKVGAWNIKERKYYPAVGNGWGEACRPPINPPGMRSVVKNFGVGRGDENYVEEQLFSDVEKITLNGQEITPGRAKKLLEQIAAPSIPDDAGKPYWVVVGSEQECQQAEKILAGQQFACIGRVQCYRPGEAMICDRSTNKPMYLPGITLVNAGGVVLGHTNRCNQAEDLIEGIRRLNGTYEPAQAPSLQEPLSFDWELTLNPWAIAALIGSLLFGALMLTVVAKRLRP